MGNPDPESPQTFPEVYFPESTSDIIIAKKNIMRGVINAFETGTKETNYSVIYIYHDGPNNIRQITLGFGITEYGNLNSLIAYYIKSNGSFTQQFAPYLNNIGKTPLVEDLKFKNLLIQASKEDFIFRNAEDEIYDQMYWSKALNWFGANQFSLPLSMMVILDSFIHSGSILGFLRDRFVEKVPLSGGVEKDWISAYIRVRRDWLANHSNLILRNTVYRMDFMINQIHNNNWVFNCPLNGNGVIVC